MTVTGRKHSSPREVRQFPQGYTAMRNGLGTQVQAFRWLSTSRPSDDSFGDIWQVTQVGCLWVKYGLTGPRLQKLWGRGHPHFIRPAPTSVSLTCRHEQDESKEKPHCGGGSWAWRPGGREDDKNWGEAGSIFPHHYACRGKCIPVCDALFSVFYDSVFLYILGWPQTYGPPASASRLSR